MLFTCTVLDYKLLSSALARGSDQLGGAIKHNNIRPTLLYTRLLFTIKSRGTLVYDNF